MLTRFLAVAIGGTAGCVLRYGTSLWAARILGSGFPFGTLFVNLAGCLLAGLLFGITAKHAGFPPIIRLLVLTGFLGGLHYVLHVRGGDRNPCPRRGAGCWPSGISLPTTSRAAPSRSQPSTLGAWYEEGGGVGGMTYKTVVIFTSEEARWHGSPLYEAIVRVIAHEKSASRCIVTRGVAGCFENGEVASHRVLDISHNMPLKIEI